MAEQDYQLVDTHYVATTSNQADVDLVFDQTGIHEEFQLVFYNSNSTPPVLVIQLNEIENLQSDQPQTTGGPKRRYIGVSVRKNMHFYPAVLSENKANPPLEFDFVNPPHYSRYQGADQFHEQPQVRYRVRAAWNSQSLILTFQQNWETPQEIDVTAWVRKRDIKLTHAPHISRIDVLAKHSYSSVSIESDYQITQSLGLNYPLLQQVFGETKAALETPDVFWPPSKRNIGEVIVTTCEKIRDENAHLIYLLTPSVDMFDQEDAQKIVQMIHWKTTSPDQNAIYNDVMKLSRRSFYSKERVVRIDDKHDEIIWPKVRKTIDRHIHLRPKNSPLNKYWVITSIMYGDMKISNLICEYSNGDKRCELFTTMPVNLENRLVFLSRNQAGRVKAWLGADDYEQIDLAAYFPDISQVEEFEFSEEFQEWY